MNEIVKIILVAVFGGFAGSLVTLIVVRWSTLKTLEAAEERLRSQLLYKEKKKTLMELYHLVEKTYPEFNEKIGSFLIGPKSVFLPEKLKNASSVKRFIAWLTNSPIVHVRVPSVSNKWGDRWMELLSTYSDYFILLIVPSWPRKRAEELKRLKKVKLCLKKIDCLLNELKSLTKQVTKKSLKDFDKYSRALRSEYKRWTDEYSNSLRKYGLI